MLLDTVNDNNRYYPKESFYNNYDKLKKMIQENRLLGELEHPMTDDVNRIYTINLKEVQIIVTKLEPEGKTVYGEFKILNTPNGVILRNLLESGVKVGVSLRGLGETKEKTIEGKTVEYVIPETFEIICWDVVHTPGFSDQKVITEQVQKLKRLESKQKLNSFEEYILVKFIQKLKNKK